MGQTQYFVLREGREWKVRHDERDYSYGAQPAAMKAAVDAAQMSGIDGNHAQVLVRNRDGTWQTAWTYGSDPYPPKV